MKKLITLLCIVTLVLMVLPLISQAQLLNKIKQKLDETVDSAVDKTLTKSKKTEASPAPEPESETAESNETASTETKEDYVSSYKSKFDFVPGERVIISDDFSQDAVGDFPALWFTNGSGEVVTLDGQEGKWLMIKGSSQAYIDQLLELPDNFTIQFDLLCSVPFSWSSDVFNLYLEDIIDLDRYRKGDNGGEMSSNNINHHFWMDLHPGVYNPGTYTTKGYGKYEFKNTREKIDLAEMWMPSAEKHILKISIWRQGPRLRVY